VAGAVAHSSLGESRERRTARTPETPRERSGIFSERVAGPADWRAIGERRIFKASRRRKGREKG
jgi:hypothetical protein